MKMRKILAGVVSAATILSMSVSAFAAGSITATLDTNNVKASNGATVTVNKEVDTTALPEEVKKVVEALKTVEKGQSVGEALKEAGVDMTALKVAGEDGKEINTEDLKVLTPVAELTIEGATPTEEDPVDVTFTVNNVTDDVDVYVLHNCEVHGWELLETEAGEADEELTASFHSNGGLVAMVYTEAEA